MCEEAAVNRPSHSLTSRNGSRPELVKQCCSMSTGGPTTAAFGLNYRVRPQEARTRDCLGASAVSAGTG
ncbi:hypothetical protein DVA67_027820 [Solirubrobacter sp. CPCC 204708]|nr:hypothetical protein [Solirubrobacter deserti]